MQTKKKILFSGAVIAVLIISCFTFVTTQAAKISSDSAKTSFKEIKMPGLLTRTSRVTNKLSFLSSDISPVQLSASNISNSSQAVSQFFKDYGSNFGISNFSRDLKFIEVQADDIGIQHFKYDQIYQGIPVFGAQMSVHLNDDFSINSAGGSFLPNISVDTKPTISKIQAETFAKQIAKEQFSFSDPSVNKIQLFIFNEKIFNENSTNDRSTLVWQAEVTEKDGFAKKILYVNAKTGTLVYSFEGNKNEIYRQVFHCNDDFLKKKCVIVRPPGTQLNEGRAEYETPSGNVDVDNIYDHLETVHDYWNEVIGRDGANESGGTGNRSVSLMGSGNQSPSETYALGYIKKNCPNAFWNGAYLSFCPNMVNLQTVAHEYMHAVSDYTFTDKNTLGLVYSYQPGAIEEGFADIFALAVDRYANGTSNWQISAPALGVIRDIAAPNSTPGRAHPSHTNDSNYYCGYGDEGGVHINSTVISNLFHNLVTGGQVNGCSIDPIAQEKAEKIFYQAMKYHLIVSENFNQLYDDLFASCKELYGIVSQECTSLITAMQSAKLDKPIRCGSYGSNPIASCALSVPRSNLVPRTIPELEIETQETVYNPSINVKTYWSLFNGKLMLGLSGTALFGTSEECNPRDSDPVIIDWGDKTTQKPSIEEYIDGKYIFSASHAYKSTNRNIEITVSAHNSCGQSATKKVKL